MDARLRRFASCSHSVQRQSGSWMTPNQRRKVVKMGGYGSTRWNWTATRATTDGLIALDVRRLAREGALRLNSSSEVGWSHCGQETHRIGIIAEADAVVLCYCLERLAGTPEPVREWIRLERTPCSYGGSRPWFVCPGCESRRAVLHCRAGWFRCRHCHDLAYGSTREAAWERAWRKAAGLRRRLTAEANPDTFPIKPEGMRWRTYTRRLAELAALERGAAGELATQAEALIV